MRKLLLVAIPLLSISAIAPALSQGVQTPNAPNATPPAGTPSNTSSSDGTAPNTPPPDGTVPKPTTSDKAAPNADKPN